MGFSYWYRLPLSLRWTIKCHHEKKQNKPGGEREKDRPVNPEDLDRHSPIEASTAGFLFFQKLPPLYNEQIKFEYNIFSVQKT
jgi:hypothetical protein